MQNIAIYPGTFDPFTLGHVDILQRALKLFDHVIVAILENKNKKPVFSSDERKQMIFDALQDEGINQRVSFIFFDGLLVDLARAQKATAVIRGLRATMDFEYELAMASTNKILYADVETMFLMADTQYAHLSSSIVREVAYFGGDISTMVPAVNEAKIIERLQQHHE